MKDNNQSSRRNFIQQTAMAGAGLMLANPATDVCQDNAI